MTNKELRRRETDKFGPYVQQVALDNANKRIAEQDLLIESLLRHINTLREVQARIDPNFSLMIGVVDHIDSMLRPAKLKQDEENGK